MAKKSKMYELRAGNFPEEVVYRTLDLEVDPGEVIFSVPAQKHAYRNHPEDVPLIVPYLAQVISDPTYVGDDFRNPGKIELVRHIPGTEGKSALVALKVERDPEGYYQVCSVYLISQSEVDKKRQRHILKNVRPWRTG